MSEPIDILLAIQCGRPVPLGPRGWTKYPRRVWTQHEDGTWSSREKTAADYRADLEAYRKISEAV